MYDKKGSITRTFFTPNKWKGINTPSKWKGYFSKTPILFKAPNFLFFMYYCRCAPHATSPVHQLLSHKSGFSVASQYTVPVSVKALFSITRTLEGI